MKQVTQYPITDSALRWLETLLAERFGQTFRILRKNESVHLKIPGAEGGIIFDNSHSSLTHAHSDQPCAKWFARREGWESVVDEYLPAPGVKNLPSPLIECSEKHYVVHYDVIGLIYWMLNRIEEIGRKDLDKHQRFQAASSHAHKYNYLHRPIIDEWILILAQVIQRAWPQIKLKQHRFHIKLSHDVDSPSKYAFKSWTTIGRTMFGDLIKRKDTEAFLTAAYCKLATGTQLNNKDPFNTFDWIMDLSETKNLVSAFYFICGRTNHIYDPDYKINDPKITNLIKNIHKRGHEIGLHPSYDTYQSPRLIKKEAELLKKICYEQGVIQKKWGGRMHYLRWENTTTLQAWDEAGMNYDSTLGYADQPGFRCGTCIEYPAFNPIDQTEMKTLRIRPLITMECSITEPMYLGLGFSKEAIKKFSSSIENCKKVNGQYTLLWHNSNLYDINQKELYKTIVNLATS